MFLTVVLISHSYVKTALLEGHRTLFLRKFWALLLTICNFFFFKKRLFSYQIVFKLSICFIKTDMSFCIDGILVFIHSFAGQQIYLVAQDWRLLVFRCSRPTRMGSHLLCWLLSSYILLYSELSQCLLLKIAHIFDPAVSESELQL